MTPELLVKFKAEMSELLTSISTLQAKLQGLSASSQRTATGSNALANANKAAAASNNQMIAALNANKRAMQSMTDAMKSNASAIQGNANALSTLNSKQKEFTSNANGLTSELRGMVGQFLSFYGAIEAARGSFKIIQDVEKFDAILKTTSKSEKDFADNLNYIQQVASKYNQNIITLGQGYARLKVATKDTNLEGEATRRIFEATAVAASAFKMSQDDVNGTMRAFIQMVSKGNVQAEELRGQLGERLVGAFNLAAKSMGVTTSELNKMLEDGKVLAEDLLPKLADEIITTFGDKALENSMTLSNSVAYLKGQFDLFFANFANSTGLIQNTANELRSLGQVIKEVSTMLTQLGNFSSAGTAAGNILETLFPGRTKIGQAVGGVAGVINGYGWDEGRRRGYISPAAEEARRRQAYKEKGGVPLSTFGIQEYSTNYIPFGQNYNKAKEDADKAADLKRKAAEKAEAEARKALNAQRDKWALEDAELEVKRSKEAMDKAIAANKAIAEKNWLHGAYGIYGKGAKPGFESASKENVDYALTGAKNKLNNFGTPWAGMGSDASSGAERARLLSKQAERMLIDMYGDLELAAEHGQRKLVDKIRENQVTSKDLFDFNSLQNLGEDVRMIFQNAASDLSSGIGEMIGNLASSVSAAGDFREMMMNTFGNLLTDLGKALIGFGTVMKAVEKALSSMQWYIAIPAGIAAVAAGQVLKNAASAAGGKAASKFATGGIVPGSGIGDSVHAMLTPGEMILNAGQQKRLFSMLDGVGFGRTAPVGSGRSGRLEGVLKTQISSQDISFVAQVGTKNRGYF